MVTVTIKISGLEDLTAAINSLAVAGGVQGAGAALSPGPAQQPQASQPSMQQPQAPQPPVQQTPVQPPASQPSMQQPQAPQPSMQQMPGPVPTTAVPQEYTQDQLAVAMTGLVERGMHSQVMGILSAMGCQTLLQVPKERYPELVLRLREAGAVI